MPTDQPLVSIVIPAYNNRRYLPAALDSCLAQTYPRCEVIVVDDGSTDGTDSLIRDRYGARVRLLRQSNRGPSAARNAGIQAAHGDYVKFCDADDQLLPDITARSMAILAAQPGASVVHTRYHYVAEDGATHLPVKRPSLPSGDVYCDLLLSNGDFVLTSAVTAPRRLLLDCGGFDESLFVAEDWDLFLRLAAQVPFHYIDDDLVLYRHHAGNLHTASLKAAQGRLIAVQKAQATALAKGCLDRAALDRLLAGRYQHLGIVYWRTGQRRAARAQFEQANRIDPSPVRRLMSLATYALPAAPTVGIINGALALRGRLRGA